MSGEVMVFIQGRFFFPFLIGWCVLMGRVCSENKALSDSLGDKGREVQELRTENTGRYLVLLLNQQLYLSLSCNGIEKECMCFSLSLCACVCACMCVRARARVAVSQQCLELLAMLNVREQRAFQGTKPSCTQGREEDQGTVLEVRERESRRNQRETEIEGTGGEKEAGG